MIHSRNQREKGQGMVEYAMILVFVAIVVLVVLSLLGPMMKRIFGTTYCALNNPVNMMDCFETPVPEDGDGGGDSGSDEETTPDPDEETTPNPDEETTPEPDGGTTP